MTNKTGLFKRSRSLGVGGALILVTWLIMATVASAQTFTTLVNFDGTNGGTTVYVSLVQGRDGNYYGTTEGGGANNEGTVFEITAAGKLRTLYSFCSQGECLDGAAPFAGLVQATDQNLYGTTTGGGAYSISGGTVFKITALGMLTTIYSFCAKANCADGVAPEGVLTQAADGNLYGTTFYGGAGLNCPLNYYSCGTVFKITLGGELTTLYNFCSLADCADGNWPAAGLLQATDGNLYGTTTEGGAWGGGTVFRITPLGMLTTVYSFCARSNCIDGANPVAGLVQGSDGNLYGTTSRGGAYSLGTVFKITPGGKPRVIYNFCSQANCADGAFPFGPLLQATDGNFYGTTYSGGSDHTDCTLTPGGCGSVFTITPAGVLTTLHSFDLADGDRPEGGLLQATNGVLYGTTGWGGAWGDGTVFSLDMGLGPFVSFVRGSGAIGATVQILGQGFTGTTSVSFNGATASFTVWANTLLTATVPAGATTGPVTVTTPSGVLTSNVPFRVMPQSLSF